jgi:hypothetical protein
MSWSNWWIDSFFGFVIWAHSVISSFNKCELFLWVDWGANMLWFNDFLGFLLWCHSWILLLHQLELRWLEASWFGGVDSLTIIHVNIVWIVPELSTVIGIGIKIASSLRQSEELGRES